MIRTIVVPTDGSANSDRAIQLAADIGSCYQARIVLLHVLLRGQMPEGLLRAARIEHLGPAGESADNLVNLPQEIMARVQGPNKTQTPLEVLEFIGAGLLSGAERICRDKGIKQVERHVEEGNTAEIIIDTSKRVGADLIVMGTRGLGNLSGLLMGSVSQKVSQLSDCNCLLVK